jgi:hypothetical protein
MADAPKILKSDKLYQMYPKLNSAIDNSNDALKRATTAETSANNAITEAQRLGNEAKNIASTAETIADSVQSQFNQVVIEGDSSVEAAQGRVDALGNVFSTLKERNDNGQHNVFKWQDGTPGSTEGLTAVSVRLGYKGNGISAGIRGAFTNQGSANNENIIGGFLDTVGLNQPNVIDPNSQSAHYASNEGYDNVVNALAAVVHTFHGKVHEAATHATMIGGSYHEIKDGDYSSILGGTEGLIDILGTTNGSGYGFIASSVRGKVYNPFGIILGGYESIVKGDFGSVIGSKWAESNGQFATNIGSVSSKANGNTSFNIGANGSEANGSGSGNLGTRNTINNGNNSLAFATDGGLINGNNAYLFGKGGWAKHNSQFVISGGSRSRKGDQQGSVLILSAQSTDRTYKNLGIEGTGIVPTIDPGFSWGFKGLVGARYGDAEKIWEVKGLFRRTRSGTTEFLGFTKSVIFEHGSTSTWDISVLAGTGTFNLRGLGEAGQTINWVANISTVEYAVDVA